MADFNSPYYPYEKVQTGYNTMNGAEEIPYKVLTYLMDMPDANGYTPVDDNDRPRVRFIKYVWHDGEQPLMKALPTPAQKQSLLFNGDRPTLNTDEEKTAHPKGYRLYGQEFWGQTQLEAQTVVKCYIGRVVNVNQFRTQIGLTFQILCNTSQETTTRTNAYARSYDIEQCIIEALNGVTMTGIGTVGISKQEHPDNGSRPISDDTGTVVGRELKMSILWAESMPPNVEII